MALNDKSNSSESSNLNGLLKLLIGYKQGKVRSRQMKRKQLLELMPKCITSRNNFLSRFQRFPNGAEYTLIELTVLTKDEELVDNLLKLYANVVPKGFYYIKESIGISLFIAASLDHLNIFKKISDSFPQLNILSLQDFGNRCYDILQKLMEVRLGRKCILESSVFKITMPTHDVQNVAVALNSQEIAHWMIDNLIISKEVYEYDRFMSFYLLSGSLDLARFAYKRIGGKLTSTIFGGFQHGAKMIDFIQNTMHKDGKPLNSNVRLTLCYEATLQTMRHYYSISDKSFGTETLNTFLERFICNRFPGIVADHEIFSHWTSVHNCSIRSLKLQPQIYSNVGKWLHNGVEIIARGFLQFHNPHEIGEHTCVQCNSLIRTLFKSTKQHFNDLKCELLISFEYLHSIVKLLIETFQSESICPIGISTNPFFDLLIALEAAISPLCTNLFLNPITNQSELMKDAGEKLESQIWTLKNIGKFCEISRNSRHIRNIAIVIFSFAKNTGDCNTTWFSNTLQISLKAITEIKPGHHLDTKWCICFMQCISAIFSVGIPFDRNNLKTLMNFMVRLYYNSKIIFMGNDNFPKLPTQLPSYCFSEPTYRQALEKTKSPDNKALINILNILIRQILTKGDYRTRILFITHLSMFGARMFHAITIGQLGAYHEKFLSSSLSSGPSANLQINSTMANCIIQDFSDAILSFKMLFSKICPLISVNRQSFQNTLERLSLIWHRMLRRGSFLVLPEWVIDSNQMMSIPINYPQLCLSLNSQWPLKWCEESRGWRKYIEIYKRKYELLLAKAQ